MNRLESILNQAKKLKRHNDNKLVLILERYNEEKKLYIVDARFWNGKRDYRRKTHEEVFEYSTLEQADEKINALLEEYPREDSIPVICDDMNFPLSDIGLAELVGEIPTDELREIVNENITDERLDEILNKTGYIK